VVEVGVQGFQQRRAVLRGQAEGVRGYDHEQTVGGQAQQSGGLPGARLRSRMAGEQCFHERGPALLLREEEFGGRRAVRLGQCESVLIGQSHDHSGSGDEGRCRRWQVLASGVLDQGVPERCEADAVALEDLGQRRTLAGPALAGGLWSGQIERGLRIADRGDQESQVLFDGVAQLAGGYELFVTVERDAVQGGGAGLVDQGW
jgi:hypothetical protein